MTPDDRYLGSNHIQKPLPISPFQKTIILVHLPLHTVNSGSEIVGAKHVSGKNIFWSTLTAKSRGGKFFEFLHCPFEGRANMHHKIQPNWQTGRCCLAGGSKGQCRKSKIFLSLLLPMQVDQYIFFPETCFAPTISEPEFTVCRTTITFNLSCLYLLTRF